MTEALFYHLERRALEDVLPGLVEKSLARGWRALIRTDTAERSDALDTLLWTYDDQSFLAHAQAGDGDATQQPVLISVEDANLNRAEIVFYVGGAQPDDWAELKDLARVVLVFDGRDSEALAGARAAWKEAKSAGHDVTYWKESPSGKFEKQN
ncbi:MAG: DNA polymerase III subunit chi [Alphaproteobacteria bacterium 64-11]|nr:DNA polymerase III subunit chi [Alphaproteobacteria bacterium]OJU14177.1 MAG: DNA polymerase III subunit chi [Alphaproteobacteria bacterium 64-11]